jgi:putative alpha-1,2-mannosidase
LENGKTITIKADNNQLDNRYIKEMKVNGKSQTRNFLTHDQLIKGANIQFQMSPVPNKQRGTTEKDVPYSLSFEKNIVLLEIYAIQKRFLKKIR